MPKQTLSLLLLALLACGCAADSTDPAGSTNPADPAAAARAEAPVDREAGFVPIFNGTDLAGWVYGTDAKGNARKAGNGYQVRDGAIYCTAADGGNLFTEKEYDDFVLRFEFKLTPGANNGIAIRSPLQGNAASDGIEIQVLDDTHPKYASLRPEQYHGSVYDVFAPQRGHLKPVGEWNEQEITADGSHVTIKLNGHTIVDANLDEVKDEAKLKKHPGLNNKSGHIGFMGHGAEVEFRNLRVKSL